MCFIFISQARQTYVKRVIAHPSFHNVDYKTSEKLLAAMEQGDVVIRPSSKVWNLLLDYSNLKFITNKNLGQIEPVGDNKSCIHHFFFLFLESLAKYNLWQCKADHSEVDLRRHLCTLLYR